MKRLFLFIRILLICAGTVTAQQKQIHRADPYAWRITQPLGDRYRVPMDTLMHNYYQTFLPSTYSVAYGYLGPLGSAGQSKIFFDRPQEPDFIFITPFWPYYKRPASTRFYNTRIPFTHVSYFTGGPKVSATDDLQVDFSGNINKRLAIGASLDYIFSRGYYDRQATKDFSYQLSGSYIGDRYELQFFLNTLNFVAQENGGITNDDYILKPDEMGGNKNGIDTRTIPVHLRDAVNRVRGKVYYVTQRYNLGFERTEQKDSIEETVFVPVSSIIHTIEYTANRRRFIAGSLPTVSETPEDNYFQHRYFNSTKTNDTTAYWSLKNTIGISLREGFNKYAKAGLAAYLTYDIRKYRLMGDTIPGSFDNGVWMSGPRKTYTDNVAWVGAELSKRSGKILTYDVNGKLGIIGSEIGSIDVQGNINTRFPLFKDTIQLRAYGFFKNTEPSYYYKHYVSNHFIWNNDFGKERRLRIGGEFTVPRWGTRLNVGVENLQNYVYYGSDQMPHQTSSLIQVFSASLDQSFRIGILNWENQLVYQKSSKTDILPLPDFSVYSNLYLLFRIAKVLHVQFGIDCRYFTKYYAQGYQPATLGFYNQDKIKVGNYPLMNAYVNMKLKQTRFFVLFSHVNKGIIGGNDYFSIPHYPLNPRSFQVGVSIDFTN